jgi:nucleoside-diphosphate-sugar epimerase
LREENEVRVLDNDLRGVSGRLSDVSSQIEKVQADIRDARAVQDACKGIDSVCHLAYLNGTEFFYTKPELVLDIGVKGIVNIIDGCIEEGVRELIVASSSEVYQTPPKLPADESVPLSIPDPLNPRYSYGGGKIISELMAINYGRKHFDKVIIFRPHNVYGPDMGWEHVIPQFVLRMKKLCEKETNQRIEFPIQGTGKESRAFVFIDDFIEGLVVAIDKGEHLGIYNIGTREEVVIEKVAMMVGDYFGREVHVVPGASAKGGTLRRCPDIEKLEKLGYIPLGYIPKISFKEGLNKTVKWYDEHACRKPEVQIGE